MDLYPKIHLYIKHPKNNFDIEKSKIFLLNHNLNLLFKILLGSLIPYLYFLIHRQHINYIECDLVILLQLKLSLLYKYSNKQSWPFIIEVLLSQILLD